MKQHLKCCFQLKVTVQMYCENLTLTLSDVVPDVKLQIFHTPVHPCSELLLLVSVNNHHH